MIGASAQAAVAHCRDITRSRAGNFYRGIRLLPEPQRSAMYVVYAWMRQADDLVDDATDQATARHSLAQFGQHTGDVFQGNAPLPEGQLWAALSYVCTQFELDQGPFDAMLAGQLWDTDHQAVETADALKHYCEQVASSVGMVCVRLWGCTSPDAMELARLRGIAFQLTNILRDVGEDMRRGRCYLPMSDMHRDTLASWHPPEACSALIVHWCEQAEAYYTESAALDRLIPRRCRSTLVAMTSIYRRILRQIAARPARSVLGPRAKLSSVHKGVLVARAAVFGR
jgi:phytoene synthase